MVLTRPMSLFADTLRLVVFVICQIEKNPDMLVFFSDTLRLVDLSSKSGYMSPFADTLRLVVFVTCLIKKSRYECLFQ